MYKNNKIIAVIPARGGSKGIPHKNIKMLLGKPLIGWSLAQVKNSKYIDEYFVSTDNNKIAKISEEFGAKIVKRPKRISGDNASTESALIHISQELNYNFDVMIVLQCTSPMRYPEQIDEAIEKMFKENADSLLTGSLNTVFFWDNNGSPLNYDYKKRPRRQDKNWEFVENGSFYIFKKHILLETGNRLGGKISQYLMPKWMSFEIDEPFDFELIKFLMRFKYLKNHELNDKISKIKLVLFDVDGVFTDGSVSLDSNGVESISFSRIDGKGVELLRNKNYFLGVISSENNHLVKKRMQKLKIENIHLGIKNKMGVYKRLKNKYDLIDEEICFCGDDVQDMPVLKKVGLSCCPQNGQNDVKDICDIVSEKNGGDGFVRDIANLFITKNNVK